MTSAPDRRRILIVDDEEHVRQLLAELCEDEGFESITADGFETAKKLLEAQAFDLVLTDKNMPDGSGMDLLKLIDADNTALMVMTAMATLESAVEAVRLGAYDYIFKPIDSIDDLARRMERALEMVRLKRSNRELVKELTDRNQTLEALAVRDPLTGLYNHAYFQESLEREISRCSRNGLSVSLVFIDLDHFKAVNDGLGHQAGDRVLRAFSQVLSGDSRQFDLTFRLRQQDIAARYGGDEFSVILPETPKDGAAVKAERLRQAIESLPYADLGLPKLTTSVGPATYPQDAANRMELIQAADTALYAAKTLGRDCMVTFSRELERSAGGTLPASTQEEGDRIRALADAIDSGAFEFAYQPIVSLSEREVVAYEAFCRPTGDLFDNPMQLLRAAERAGRIVDLGRQLRKACGQVIERLESEASLFINLHPHELNDMDFVQADSVLGPLAERVVFEVDADIVQKNLTRTLERLKALRKQGFRLSVGQLGGGYQSLDALSEIRPQYAKVSSHTIAAAHSGDATSKRLLRHLVELCQEETITVVAEAVENDEVASHARELGCTLGQGYLFGKAASL